MPSTIQIRNLKLGEGLPKICIPLTDSNLQSLKQSLNNLKDSPCDLVEWRADFYENFRNEAMRNEALTTLRKELGNTPLLFTIRTSEEGGQAVINTEEYESINRSVIETGLADLVDVELSRGDDVMKNLADLAHNATTQIGNPAVPNNSTAVLDNTVRTSAPDNSVKIVGSRHDFHKTPPKDFLIESLCRMQELGADVVKFAVMPACERDVLTLLDATISMKEEHPETPVITMSMGRLGAFSRICGKLSGSAVTFGTAGHASAPGQLPADLLKTILESLA